MKRAPIRSTIFNILFVGITALMCVALLPTLILPRRYYMGTVHAFVHMVYFLERTVLGLKLDLQGLENLPKSGAYILAAKHQSAYETMKLHLLFDDPAVILKKELLRIPLWGAYLRKSDPIAIDRSDRESAVKSIQDGALRIQAQGRPIVIFPQGTRVKPDTTPAQKPYKIGVARIQEATGLPIIPMAINAGCFWPRTGWLKSSGLVTFKFLSPIEAGKDRKELMSELEEKLETESNALAADARKRPAVKKPRRGKGLLALASLLLLGVIAAAAYTTYWHKVAEGVEREYVAFIAKAQSTEEVNVTPPVITGFPGKIHLSVEEQVLSDPRNTLTVNNLKANAWPIPGAPITIEAGPVLVRNFRWKSPLEFQSVEAVLTERSNLLDFKSARIAANDFSAEAVGTLDLNQRPFPKPAMELSLYKHMSLLSMLTNIGVLDARASGFMGAGLANFQNEDGAIVIPITQKGRTILAGPLPVFTFPAQISADSLRRDSGSPPPPSP